MRVRQTNGDLSVHAIVGTHVALFGMDLPKSAINDLIGFAIRRTNHPDRVLIGRCLFEDG